MYRPTLRLGLSFIYLPTRPHSSFLIPHSPLLPLICAMNPTSIYAIAAGGVVVMLIIIKSLVSVEQVLRALALLAAKHFTYPYLVRRHRLLGPWSRADVFLQLIYFHDQYVLYDLWRHVGQRGWSQSGNPGDGQSVAVFLWFPFELFG